MVNTKNIDIKKPMSVERYEFIRNIASLINDSQLPIWAIEDIIKDTYESVRIRAAKKLEEEYKQYDAELKSALSEMESKI